MGKSAEKTARERAADLPFFSDRDAGGSDEVPQALEVSRVAPKRRYLGALLPTATPDEVQELVESKDSKANRRGALYRIVLKAESGKFITSRDVRYHDEPEDDDDDGRSNGKMNGHGAPDAWTQLITLMRQQSEEARRENEAARKEAREETRAREAERAAEHRRQMELARAEAESRSKQTAAEAEARMERERVWLDGMLERDRLFFSEQRKNDGGAKSLLETFMAGMQIEKDRQDDDGGGLLGPLMDKFGKKMLRRLDDDDDDEKPTKRNGKANGRAKERDDDDREGVVGREAERFRALVLSLGEKELTKVMLTYVETGDLSRKMLRAIASGEADEILRKAYGRKHVDKVKRAAETARRALRAAKSEDRTKRRAAAR